MFSLLLFVITIWGKLLMLGLEAEAKSCFLVVSSALSVGLDYIIFEGDALHAIDPASPLNVISLILLTTSI
jgi:hypothetical protein